MDSANDMCVRSYTFFIDFSFWSIQISSRNPAVFFVTVFKSSLVKCIILVVKLIIIIINKLCRHDLYALFISGCGSLTILSLLSYYIAYRYRFQFLFFRL
jgi:hypothetical protein